MSFRAVIKNFCNNIIMLIFVALLSTSIFAQQKYYSEYEVKGAFLEKFTQFIEWPSESQIEDTSKSFVIGIIGKNEINKILKEKYEVQKIMDKRVEILEIASLDDIKSCHMLYISNTKNLPVEKILDYTKNKPILTVSDDIDASEKGVIITLFIKDNHVYFQINNSAIKNTGLYASTLLLSLSKNINAGGE
ncbi:MAG: YfiR family protein [Melioribacteraceae bacterium]|nr:YfiR family protein [Melioribacteraceae bacterium]MCF8355364.1 YfiR family protein [Melioribacteraceae bacterium]MCF8395176.1 YfiR family protein [Melioribacteraceae bacterium]MCF8420255.1 YfiR family protein [Melioribacteraceae bacterium]